VTRRQHGPELKQGYPVDGGTAIGRTFRMWECARWSRNHVVLLCCGGRRGTRQFAR